MHEKDISCICIDVIIMIICQLPMQLSLSDYETLQIDLDSLAQWESDWQMKFNVAKCHSMRVTRHSPLKQIKYNNVLHNQTLEQVTSAKYLGMSGVRLSDGPDIKLFILVGLGRSFFVCCLAHRGSTVGFLLLLLAFLFLLTPVFQWCCSTPQGSPGVGRNTFLSSPHLWFIIVFICDLFVSRDDPLMS